jgi:ankyrin repeat protein
MNPTPIFIACRNGHLSVVRQLIAAGADLSLRNSRESQCLMLAAQGGHAQVTQLVLPQPGIVVDDLNHEGSTPLSMAAQNGHAQVVQMLLAAGANKNHVCKGRTPKQWAKVYGHNSVAALL